MIAKHQSTVDRQLDRIDAAGHITHGSVHRLLALIHHAVDAGFDEVSVSLTDCTGAWAWTDASILRSSNRLPQRWKVCLA